MVLSLIEQTLIEKYAKMTEYEMFDPNKIVEMVVLKCEYLRCHIIVTTVNVPENAVMTFEFCNSLFEKKKLENELGLRFYYGVANENAFDVACPPIVRNDDYPLFIPNLISNYDQMKLPFYKSENEYMWLVENSNKRRYF